jgi:hypothetical protein
MDRDLLIQSFRYCRCNILLKALVKKRTREITRYRKTSAYKISPTLNGIHPNASLGKIEITGYIPVE